MDIRAILHHIQQGVSDRRTAEELGVNRRTVQQYRKWAQEQGLLAGPLPPPEQLQALIKQRLPAQLPPQNRSSVAQYQEQIVKLHQQGVEIAAIWARLQEQGYTGGYHPVYRLVRKLAPTQPEVFVRVERKPGEEAQVDFGYVGYLLDAASGRRRKAWAFVMTLSWSRHMYVEFVFDQTVATWLRLHRNALAFFNGVPQRIVIDNLKAGIVTACFDDPQVQHAYGECAEHYGFRVAPCRPATPEHKGKVESGVHYVQRNFMAGRDLCDLAQANRDVRHWCLTTAGQRIHGTTKARPLDRYTETEAAALRPLPATPYDLVIWKEVKLHRDCHINFDNAYYSAPFRLVGQRLRVQGGSQVVRIYTQDYELVATHDRAGQAGERITHPDHLPPEKLDGLYGDRASCQAVAQDIGPAAAEVVASLLADPIVDRLATARRLLKLRQKYNDQRLEAACHRALRFGDPSYMTVKRILEHGQEQQPLHPAVAAPAPAHAFIRNATELFGDLLGGLRWN
ncbi:MAG: IS21 family transposase [Caldilineaceae bacterium]|jgi:transposase